MLEGLQRNYLFFFRSTGRVKNGANIHENLVFF